MQQRGVILQYNVPTVLPDEISFDTVTSSYEFIDTEGGMNRLQMTAGKLYWLKSETGAWWSWKPYCSGERLTFIRQTRRLALNDAHVTVKETDVPDLLAHIVIPLQPCS